MYAIGAISGKASGTLPSWNKQKVENLFFCSLRESQNRPPKNWAKKRVRMTLNFFISRTFFSCPPRQSTPLGRFRGGRATQKVAQTKTPMEREVSKSLERVKILTERPFSRSINSSRLSMVMLSWECSIRHPTKLPTPENVIPSRYVIGSLRREGFFNGHSRSVLE